MKNEKPIRIFLVDDDAVFLKLMGIEFLQYPTVSVETFATGELCLQNLEHKPDVIILDYYLNGVDKDAMNGIEILDKIKLIDPNVPVIMLSIQDKIEIAINCMHHKAVDYVVKNETSFHRVKKIINDILSYKKIETQLGWYMDRM